MRRSVMPVVGLACVLVAGLSHVSAASLAVWLAGVAILGYCAGRRYMRRPDNSPRNRR